MTDCGGLSTCECSKLVDEVDAAPDYCFHAIPRRRRRWSASPVLERSRSGQGGHVWLFFEHAVPATLARRADRQ